VPPDTDTPCPTPQQGSRFFGWARCSTEEEDGRTAAAKRGGEGIWKLVELEDRGGYIPGTGQTTGVVVVVPVMVTPSSQLAKAAAHTHTLAITLLCGLSQVAGTSSLGSLERVASFLQQKDGGLATGLGVSNGWKAGRIRVVVGARGAAEAVASWSN